MIQFDYSHILQNGDNVELTRIFSALFSSPNSKTGWISVTSSGCFGFQRGETAGRFLRIPPGILEASTERIRRTQIWKRWTLPWQVLDCLGLKRMKFNPTKPSQFSHKTLDILEVLNGSQMLEELQQWISSWLSWPKCLVESPSYYFAAMVQWFQLARSRDFAHRARTWQSSCTQAGVMSHESIFSNTQMLIIVFLDYGIRSDLQSGSFFDFFVDDSFQTLFGVALCINESWNSGCVVRANWNACSSVDDSIRWFRLCFWLPTCCDCNAWKFLLLVWRCRNTWNICQMYPNVDCQKWRGYSHTGCSNLGWKAIEPQRPWDHIYHSDHSSWWTHVFFSFWLAVRTSLR